MAESSAARAKRLFARIREKGVFALARRFVGLAALYGWHEAMTRTRGFALANGEPLEALQRVLGYARTREAQFEFCRRFAADPPAWRQRIVERLVSDAGNVRGVVLCPVAVPEAGTRAERVMRVMAREGYAGLMLPIDSAVPTVERLDERLHVAHLFPDAFARYRAEPVVLYIDAPRFAYVAQLFERPFIIYDVRVPMQGSGADFEAERADHAALLAAANVVLSATSAFESAAAGALPVPEGAEDAAVLAPALSRLDEWSRAHARPVIEQPPTRRVDILTFNFFDWQGERVYNGGAERYVLDLALLCRRLGLEARLLQNAHHAFQREYHGIPVVGLPLAAQFDLSHMSEGYSSHVADAALVIASPLELAARLTGRTRVVGINHGIHWDAGTNALATFMPQRDRLLFDALQRVDACVCVDTNFINWVRCHDWQLAQALDYVPNYVDLAVFRPVAKDFLGERLVVLYPRRLYKARGFQDTVEACDRLLARGVPIDVHLCGGANEAEAALARAFIARHPRHVRWFELDIREMHCAYEASHVALIPTNWAEGTSLSCIEAMATRNAVVATSVGGLPNLVLDGFNGLLVKPGAAGLQGALERLVDDRTLCATLAANALLVAPTLSQSRWERQWTEALHRIVPALVSPPSPHPALA